MNRISSSETTSILSWIQRLKNELHDENTLILVEGKRDKNFFLNIGISEHNLLSISHLGVNQLLEIICQKINSPEIICIPLVDFDKAGRKYLSKLKTLPVYYNCDDTRIIKIILDTYFRRELATILKGRYPEIEALSSYLEKLHITIEDLE